MCSNCASRSGCWEPSRVFWLACKPKPLALQKLPQRPLGDLMPHPHQRRRAASRGSWTSTAAATRDRRAWPDRSADPDPQPPPDPSRPPADGHHRTGAPARARPARRTQARRPATDRLLREPRHTRKQRHPTRPMRLGLARRPQPPAALVTLRAEQTPALSDLRLRHTIKRRRQSVGLWHATSIRRSHQRSFT